jgi:hypothetical protein
MMYLFWSDNFKMFPYKTATATILNIRTRPLIKK